MPLPASLDLHVHLHPSAEALYFAAVFAMRRTLNAAARVAIHSEHRRFVTVVVSSLS